MARAQILKRGYFMAGIGLSEGHNEAGSGIQINLGN